MKICIFLTTRHGSTRLPGKHLMQIREDTVTDILIERIKESKLPVIMTTPSTPEDILYMGSLAKKHEIGYYAGDKGNIIQRHINCAKMNEVDWIVNVDGDDILTCPDLIQSLARAIEGSFGQDCFHLHNYPLGMNLIAYTPDRLLRTTYSKDTNWGAKIMEAGGASGLEGILFNNCRLTLDYIPDYIVVKHIIDTLGKKCDSKEICDYMLKHPEICAINNYLNEQYFQRLEDLSK